MPFGAIGLLQEALLAAQLLAQRRPDRDHGLAPQLDVQVTQVRVVIGADLQRVARQRDDARDPQPGERQQQDHGAMLL